jgi:[NiFe] hydrogenase diaphorase moiety large subunit
MGHQAAEIIAHIAAQFGNDRGRLLDMVRALHAHLGHVSEESIGALALELGIHRVEVRDMVSFYAFLARKPQGKTVIRLCNAVVERMKGADAVGAAFEQALGIGFGETTPDGAITLLHTACIGLSDQAPGALVNHLPLAHLLPEDVPEIVAAIRNGEDLMTLPQAEIDVNIRKAGEVIFAPMERGAAIRNAISMTPEQVINEINKARLRGCGGAGFPTAMKWDFCRKAQGSAHYIVCNGDEGEPGTFKDRAILMECPDLLFEGLTVAGYAIGATEGIFYLRAEYEYLAPRLMRVLAKRRHLGLLGDNICGCEGFSFDIRIQLGAGAYICGEESALLESAEGKRGAPRDRPPFPVQKGYKNQPTAVNNIETLCCAARILEMGGEWFAAIGTRGSMGTKLLSVSGDCALPGVYEMPYGITVMKLLDLVGAQHAQAVQIGGPSGRCLAPKDFGRGISFEDVPTGGSVIIFGADRDLIACMRQFVEFFVEESCGWCVPCRVGTTLLLKKLDKILSGKAGRDDLKELDELARTIKTMSRCGLGQTAANPVLTTRSGFPGLYEARVQDVAYVSDFDLRKAMAPGCAIAGREAELAGVQA